MSRRPFTAPPENERCVASTTSMPTSRKADGTEGARCMHRRIPGSDRCAQHAKQRFQCGDGTRFATLEGAVEYANSVARRTNVILSIEEIK